MNALSIYKSSAGSGKTYTLVREYLKLILPYPTQFRHVLAITFTNKATDEMKNRILKALIELSEGKNKRLEEELAQEKNLSQLNLREQAQKCLNFILHHYTDFAVTTIDSFFNSIVKSLAHEMKLPLRFEVEIDQEYINEEICQRLLNEIGKDEKLTSWLQAFAFDKMEDDKGWKINSELKIIGQQLFRENFYSQEIKKEFDYDNFVQQLKIARKDFEEAARKFGIRFKDHLLKNNYSVDDFSYKEKGVAGYLSKIAGSDLIGTDYKAGAYTEKAHDEIEKWLTKENRKNPVADLVASTLHPLLSEYMQFYKTDFQPYCTACESLKLIYVAGIVSHLAKHFRDYRDEHDLITIADANLLIKNFVTANDSPFVYEKTGNKFRHFLIDEFQDTSDVQWKNLLPLINNALASGNSALIVGDVKQAIYRWRGGNMNLLQNEIKADLKNFAQITTEKKLSINYRSAREVIEFNNSFFEKLPAVIGSLEHADYDLIAAAYQVDEVTQLLPEKNKLNGFVKISFINEAELSEVNIEKTKWKQESLERLVPTIDTLLSDGFTYGDIAILVRSGFEGNEIARYLFTHGINQIISADSLLIHKAPQVQFIVNLIRYLHDEENILVKKELLYFSTRFKEDAIDLDHIFSERDDEINSLFHKNIVAVLHKKINSLKQLPVYDLAEQLIKLFELNKTADAYLQRLLDVMLEYIEKNQQDSLSFINWWDDHAERKGFSVITPSQGNAITIMTIHKSKGLQFPVVLMPYCDWQLKPKAGELLWVSSDEQPYNTVGNLPVSFSASLEHTFFNEHHKREVQQTYIDNINLLYVAFTRAEERLYITSKYSETKSATSVCQVMLNVIKQNATWQRNYIESENELIIGNEIKKVKPEGKINIVDLFHPQSLSLPGFPITEWQTNLGIKTKIDFRSEEIDFGNILHKTLSFIITENDLEAALNKSKNMYVLNDADLLKIRADILKIFELTKQHEWFTGKYAVRNEADLFFENEIFRPDRIMFNKEVAIILDYKTGVETDTYKKQITQYKNALATTGFNSVKSFLLYTTEIKLTEL